MIHSFYDFGYILSELVVLVYGLAFIQRFFIHPSTRMSSQQNLLEDEKTVQNAQQVFFRWDSMSTKISIFFEKAMSLPLFSKLLRTLCFHFYHQNPARPTQYPPKNSVNDTS